MTTTRRYQVIRNAIANKQNLAAFYDNYYRVFSPHTIGHTGLEARVLGLQFAGGSSRGLAHGGNWRCFAIDRLEDVEVVAGSWHTLDTHSRPQTCIRVVDLEVSY